MSHAIISSKKILSEDNGEILISINDLFLSENLRRVKRPKDQDPPLCLLV